MAMMTSSILRCSIIFPISASDPTTGMPWICCFSFAGLSSKNPTGLRLRSGFFCSSRTTSAPASPAPMINARLAGLFFIELAAVLTLSAIRRMAKRVPPTRNIESSQSMISTERGNPLKTLKVNSKIITAETSTEALVTARKIKRNSLVLAYPHKRRYRLNK